MQRIRLAIRGIACWTRNDYIHASHTLDKSMAWTTGSVARIKTEAFGLIGAVASRRRTTEIFMVGCGSFVEHGAVAAWQRIKSKHTPPTSWTIQAIFPCGKEKALRQRPNLLLNENQRKSPPRKISFSWQSPAFHNTVPAAPMCLPCPLCRANPILIRNHSLN